MLASGTIRFLCLIGGSVIPATLAALTIASPVRSQDISVPDNSGVQSPSDPTDPNNVPTVVQSSGLLSIRGGQRLLAEADSAIAAQNYALAQQRLQQARQIFNQLSNFHQQIATSFSGIDNQVTQDQRRSALESAQLRDRATYQLALVHRAQNQPELAVPLLVQIVRSQNPTRDLGQQAYLQLVELGFVSSTSTPRPTVGSDREAAAPESDP